MTIKGISETSMPKPQIYTLEKDITNSRDHLCDSNLEIQYESPVLLKFHYPVWKNVVSYADG